MRPRSFLTEKRPVGAAGVTVSTLRSLCGALNQGPFGALPRMCTSHLVVQATIQNAEDRVSLLTFHSKQPHNWLQEAGLWQSPSSLVSLA